MKAVEIALLFNRNVGGAISAKNNAEGFGEKQDGANLCVLSVQFIEELCAYRSKSSAALSLGGERRHTGCGGGSAWRRVSEGVAFITTRQCSLSVRSCRLANLLLR